MADKWNARILYFSEAAEVGDYYIWEFGTGSDAPVVACLRPPASLTPPTFYILGTDRLSNGSSGVRIWIPKEDIPRSPYHRVSIQWIQESASDEGTSDEGTSARIGADLIEANTDLDPSVVGEASED